MSNNNELNLKTLFPKIEEDVLQKWNDDNSFQKSIDRRRKDDNSNDFVFYDGPPFANGLPHYGHLLTGFIKDAVARYWTLKGKKVERKFGWDCHGLPAEMEVEKETKIQGTAAIKEYGIGKFNDACRNSVMKYASEWKKYVTRQGRWVDFDNSYKTMDKNYMESVIWAFKKLFDKGLVYEDYRVVPYSWKCQSTVSNFETKMDNAFRQKESKAITVKFPLQNIPDFIAKIDKNIKKCYMLVWTTTPWTLPANLALAVNSEIAYTVIVKENEAFIVASNLKDKAYKMLGIS
jgi:isoleucyl-tRNA synthetase